MLPQLEMGTGGVLGAALYQRLATSRPVRVAQQEPFHRAHLFFRESSRAGVHRYSAHYGGEGGASESITQHPCSQILYVAHKIWERLFAVHGLSERTTVQTSSLLLRLFFFTSWPTRPVSLTLTQTPTPADRVVPIHSWRPLGHSTVWADFVCVSGSVLYLVRTQSKK